MLPNCSCAFAHHALPRCTGSGGGERNNVPAACETKVRKTTRCYVARGQDNKVPADFKQKACNTLHGGRRTHQIMTLVTSKQTKVFTKLKNCFQNQNYRPKNHGKKTVKLKQMLAT